MVTNKLKAFLCTLLNNYISSHYLYSENNVFPKCVYDIKQISIVEEPYKKYILTLNLYDKVTTEKIDNIADNISNDIGLAIYSYENMYIKIIKQDNRQNIIEQDKSLRRIMFTFEIRIFLRSEE